MTFIATASPHDFMDRFIHFAHAALSDQCTEPIHAENGPALRQLAHVLKVIKLVLGNNPLFH